jgi:two-component system, cell cycle response regulator DivK
MHLLPVGSSWFRLGGMMKQVLVIEDNKDNLRLISVALNQYGYEALPAETGEEGIELAIKALPFFILLDINLPGMDGFETARRLRGCETLNNIPIIAITSYAMLGDREKIMAAGCNGYFDKPIDPITIMDRIHEIILRYYPDCKTQEPI